ncbi:MAG: SDR family NAD(P)-dependent oxidoreductase [Firmicutes bacterium]|nr:SDR family NAD(P)-dependent oxidoreductase [Alicyclobacillaceae bacterium]MCL6496013.1 SDR family NAD(P)-dependent oxidoreductase [Bacillota bacterium]
MAEQSWRGGVAVVTGAGSGMGRAFARRLGREEGMRLGILDVEAAALEAVQRELEGEGVEVVAVRADVSDAAAVKEAADAILGRWGTVDVLINNAGIEGYLDGPIWEAEASDWAWTFGVNFWGVVHCTQQFLPAMLAQDRGLIVNTASMTALVTSRNMYAITKHAVLAFSETLRQDLAQRGSKVQVAALCPGIVATRLFQGSRNRPARYQRESKPSEWEKGQALRETMHQRLAQGMDPAEVVSITLDGVRRGKFYILTDHEWDPQIIERHQEILAGAP